MKREYLQDVSLIALASIALLVEIAVLLQQMRVVQFNFPWSIRSGDHLDIGEVISRTRSLKRRAASSLTWYPMGEGDPIFSDDTVMTGAESSARINLRDSGELVLEPYTLVRFSERSRLNSATLSLELNQGTVKLKSVGALRIHVRSQDIALKPNTEVELSATPLATQSEIHVTRGEADVDGVSGESQKVAAGEAFRVGAERKLARVETKLSVLPRFPPNGSRVVAATDPPELRFEWDGDGAESVEWDTDPAFPSPLTSAAAGNESRAKMQAGTYYWRVRRGVASSPPTSFTLLPKIHYQATSPSDGAVVKNAATLLCAWQPVAEADAYEIELSAHKDFSKILKHDTVDKAEKDWGALKNGKYFWRLRARHPKWGEWPESRTYAFQVKSKIAPPRPKGVKILPQKEIPKSVVPAQGPSEKSDEETAPSEPESGAIRPQDFWFRLSEFIYPSAFAETKRQPQKKKGIPAFVPSVVPPSNITLWMEFEWHPSDGAARYRLEVSANRDFSDMLSRIDVPVTHALLDLPDRENYFWRVASIDEEGELGSFSKVQSMHRTKAKPKPPERIIASVPPPEEKPAAPSVPLRWGFTQARAGYGFGIFSQSIQNDADAYHLDNSGTSGNRVQAALGVEIADQVFELQGYFQHIMTMSQNGNIQYFQPGLSYSIWGGEVQWKNAFTLWVPFSVGVRLRKEADFVRVGVERVGVTPRTYLGPLIGPTFKHRLGNYFRGQTEILLDFAVSGERRGVSLMGRSRWEFLALGNLRPSLEFVLYPNSRSGYQSKNHETNLEFLGSFLLTWDFGDEV